MDWINVLKLKPRPEKLLKISLLELSKHNTIEDAWLAIHGRVYNVTDYFNYHPGGSEELQRGIGLDASDLWDKTHPWLNIDAFMANNCVGVLVKNCDQID